MRTGVKIAAIALVCALVGWTALAQKRGKEDLKPGPFDVSPLETEVLGYSRWLRGGSAALRMVVSDHQTGNPLRAHGKIALASAEKGAESATLFNGRTNSSWTVK